MSLPKIRNKDLSYENKKRELEEKMNKTANSFNKSMSCKSLKDPSKEKGELNNPK
jgi:hypothetical protein